MATQSTVLFLLTNDHTNHSRGSRKWCRQPHQITGLYAAGTTCANRTNPSYDSWGNETSRTYNGTTATLSYDKLDKLVQWNAGSTNKAWYAYDASGGRTLARSITGSGTSLTVYAFGLEEHVYNSSGSNVSNTSYYSLGGRLIGKFGGNPDKSGGIDAKRPTRAEGCGLSYTDLQRGTP